jgi:sigma-54 specific flagellar transcriptional regulator A
MPAGFRGGTQHLMPPLSSTPIIGKSASTQALLALIKVLANSHSTVLVSGESGTGKELVAQALHRQSPRRKGPFVPINCGAIPKDLLESELFGHRKGAFTGAIADRLGRFEMADGGTLFLDEIGDLPLDMQVKLLRVLQDRAIQPVGATRQVDIDVRVVAATHKDLAAAVDDGRFREDLYYRLNVLPCHTTPLRERPQDVRDLLDFYAARHALDGQEPISFAPDLSQALLAYAWPGNVRELSNLVDRFTTLFPARRVTLAEIPLPMLPPGMRPRAAAAVSAVAAAPVIMATTGSVAAVPPLAGDEMIFTLLGESGLPPAPAHAAANAGVMSMPDARGLVGPGTSVQAAPPEAGLLGVAGGDSAGFGATTEVMGDEPLNRVEEIVCLAQGIVSLPPEGLPLKQQLTKIERSLIEQALLRTNGNVSQTARLLQLQRTTLIEKIQKYELRVG